MEPCNIALNIETTGLGPTDTITCVAIAARDHAWTWTFQSEQDKVNSADFIAEQLDNAALIFTYNGAAFDIPFMQREFQYSDQQVGAWMAKLVDPLYAARALLGYGACPKLSVVLELNGLPSKTGSGADAVALARNGQWDELVDYCINDTKLTLQLLELPQIKWVEGLVFRPETRGCWLIGGN